MKTPEAQISRVEKPIAGGAASPKAELIKARGGEKMIILDLNGEKKKGLLLFAGNLGKNTIELSSFSSKPEPTMDALSFNTTTCCDHDKSRPDGSCPPSACTQ
jgi:hypothetical protein